ncbi:MAG: hypothetical protein V4714_14095 [Bacteroidota bacterium]
MSKNDLLLAVLASLCLSFIHPVTAQRSPNKPPRDTIAIDLGSKNRIIVPVTNVRNLEQLPSLNLLIRQLNQDLAAGEKSLINAKYATTVLYKQTAGGGRTLKVNTKAQERSELYVAKESGVIKTRLNMDSIIVELDNKRKMVFLVDSIAVMPQLEKEDIDALIPAFSKEIQSYLENSQKNGVVTYNKEYMALYEKEAGGGRKLVMNESLYHTTDMISLFGNTGVGLVRDKIVPEFGLSLAFVRHEKSFIGLNATMHYFFDRQPDGKYNMAINTFLTLELAHRTGNFWQKVGVGYLVGSQGNYFGKNTVKLSLNLYSKPRQFNLHLIPELIITDNFKTAFPGIRVGVGF